MLLTLTARLEGNKRSDDGRNEDGMMQLLAIGIFDDDKNGTPEFKLGGH